MSDENKYNLKSPAVRRLLREFKDLEKEKSLLYEASPTEQDIFTWHFSIRGPSETPFSKGKYHGKILFPASYPFKPPSIIFLTPNGRFETNKKICLSFTEYHPETWQPSWGVQTVLMALISFMPTPSRGSIGSLSYPPEEIQRLALLSDSYNCKECGVSLSQILNGSLSADSKDISPQLKADIDTLLSCPTPASQSSSGNKDPSKPQPSETQKVPVSDSISESIVSAQPSSVNPKVATSSDALEPKSFISQNSEPCTIPEIESIAAPSQRDANNASSVLQPVRDHQNNLPSTRGLDLCIALVSTVLAYLIINKIF
ncbi:Ubiquitin-conjugating enzyme E2 J1 [Smittium mucronatum]|uniref:Ubiquitin-conjugating enzyme E2 J1 n=1 Tax=Smittium mucronatum TaxID=133383 RepID=A0A1R0H2S7_9FUNG|nr:Ubiquitin-conjugating enzyme E2 J1 [Smittium mucronatum]